MEKGLGHDIRIDVRVHPWIPRTCAQILEEREHRGKRITCIQSGLRGSTVPCGTDGNYAYVFVGSVLSVTEISDTEKRLQLLSEELFLGDATSPLTVTTSQGACLPEIQAGDKWLFYLRRERESDVLFLSYGGPSGPLAEANEDIEMLRHLAHLTDSGVVKGDVTRRYAWDGEGAMFPLVNHIIVAKRKSDGFEYRATTNRSGQSQFEHLPWGSYDLNPAMLILKCARRAEFPGTFGRPMANHSRNIRGCKSI